MAAPPTTDATKKDCWYGYPEDIRVATDPLHLLFDSRALEPADEAFLADIGSDEGIHTPIKVRRMDGELWCVFGRKRLLGLCEVNRRRAAKGLERRKIPYLITQGDDKTVYGYLVSENEHRAEDSMLGRAAKAVKYMELGASVKECALKFGKTTGWVKQMVALHSAAPEVQAAVTAKTLSGSKVVELSRLPRAEQLAELPKRIEAEAAGESVKDVARQVRNTKRAAKGEEPISPLPGRRVWAKLVEMVYAEEIELFSPASKGKPEVKGIDHTVLLMARVLSGQANLRVVPGLTAALRKAGFEADR